MPSAGRVLMPAAHANDRGVHGGTRMASHFPHLFQPIRLGSRQSRNRVMRLATLTNTMENGAATDHTVALYRRVARGGSGVIVTEGMTVHANIMQHAHVMQLHRKEVVPSLRRVTDAVHEEGALIVCQLNHGGRQHRAADVAGRIQLGIEG